MRSSRQDNRIVTAALAVKLSRECHPYHSSEVILTHPLYGEGTPKEMVPLGHDERGALMDTV